MISEVIFKTVGSGLGDCGDGVYPGMKLYRPLLCLLIMLIQCVGERIPQVIKLALDRFELAALRLIRLDMCSTAIFLRDVLVMNMVL